MFARNRTHLEKKVKAGPKTTKASFFRAITGLPLHDRMTLAG